MSGNRAVMPVQTGQDGSQKHTADAGPPLPDLTALDVLADKLVANLRRTQAALAKE